MSSIQSLLRKVEQLAKIEADRHISEEVHFTTCWRNEEVECEPGTRVIVTSWDPDIRKNDE